MKIKEVRAKKILDSRGEKTIAVFVRNENGTFLASAPNGRSIGKYENPAFVQSIEHDIEVLKDTDLDLSIESFQELEKIESILKGVVGANTLFALEAGILKALAYENNMPLWKFLGGGRKFPFPIGNIIGGGLHTPLTAGRKPDFQEFLIIPKMKKVSDNIFILKKAHETAESVLKLRGAKGNLNAEKAWSTDLENEGCINVLNQVREELSRELDSEINIGIDVAASSFYKGITYNYKNPTRRLKAMEQVNYIGELAYKFMLSYIEDPLHENAFSEFKILRENISKKRPCLVVGDDLTASQLERFKKAIQARSIGGIILKPNQVGSLIEIKKLVDMAKKFEIATIMSHRSGETMDMTIADLAFGWQCDFIKTGIIGKEREAKLNRLIEIERSLA